MLRKDTIEPILLCSGFTDIGDTTEFFSHSIRKLLGYIRTNRTNNPNIFELSVKNEKSIRSERSPLYPAPPAFGFPLTPPFAPEFPQSISSSICFVTPPFAPKFP